MTYRPKESLLTSSIFWPRRAPGAVVRLKGATLGVVFSAQAFARLVPLKDIALVRPEKVEATVSAQEVLLQGEIEAYKQLRDWLDDLTVGGEPAIGRPAEPELSPDLSALGA